MPNMNNFTRSSVISVTKTSSGYDVTIADYVGDVLVRTRTQSFGGVTGRIQYDYPDIYQTITNVSELGISQTLDLRTNKGLRYLCANCTSLTEFNVSQVTLPSEGLYSNEYAFYNCSSLIGVIIGDGLAQGNGATGANYCESMFEGCSSLAHIFASYTDDMDNTLATIDLSNSLAVCKDMFKGCTNLAGLRIINGTGENDIMAEQTIDGITYEHGYDYLGLRDYQFSIV